MDDDGVTTTLGEVLMLLVAFAIASYLATLVEPDAPRDTVHADVIAVVECGAGSWGDGDERLVLTHAGGEPIGPGRVIVEINGSRMSVDAAGPPWDDGVMGFDESWSHTTAIDAGHEVRWSIVAATDEEESTIVERGIARDFTCKGS